MKSLKNHFNYTKSALSEDPYPKLIEIANPTIKSALIFKKQ